MFNPFLIPPPLEVIRTAIPMLMSGEILGDVTISMTRVLVGFADRILAGVVTGVLLGRIRLLHDLLDPIIELLRYLSPTAMIPIAVIWFGIGELSKYFLIFWGTFFIVVINTTAGVWRAPIARQRAAQCLGANQLQIFLLVVVPSAVPYIVTGMRVAMASSFMSIIPAEFSWPILALAIPARNHPVAANQSHFRSATHDLRIGFIVDKSSVSLSKECCPLHVIRIADLTTKERAMHNIMKVLCLAFALMFELAAAKRKTRR